LDIFFLVTVGEQDATWPRMDNRSFASARFVSRRRKISIMSLSCSLDVVRSVCVIIKWALFFGFAFPFMAGQKPQRKKKDDTARIKGCLAPHTNALNVDCFLLKNTYIEKFNTRIWFLLIPKNKE